VIEDKLHNKGKRVRKQKQWQKQSAHWYDSLKEAFHLKVPLESTRLKQTVKDPGERLSY